jgi:hypothetical protein
VLGFVLRLFEVSPSSGIHLTLECLRLEPTARQRIEQRRIRTFVAAPLEGSSAKPPPLRRFLISH